MSKRILQIDASGLKDKKVEDSITIRLKTDDNIQFNFAKFFIQSKYLLDKYKYYDALASIQSEIDELEQKFNISDESIKYFIEFIEESKIKLPIEHYRDIYTLCEHFCIPHFTLILDKISQEELFNNLSFTIQILQDSLTSKNGFETKMTPKIENFLKDKINDCIKNLKFGELPVSNIFRIVELSKEKVDQNLLIDFILDSAETRFILLKFVELHKLRDDKVNEFIKFICEQDEYSRKKYLEYIPFNLAFIVDMKNKYDQLLNEMNQTKQELNQTKQELNQTKQELNQTNQIFEHIKKEQDECKKELKQSIIISGYDQFNQLGERPNNKDKDGFPVIYPPVLKSFNPSSLSSYSIYWCHSVMVMSDGSLKGVGDNRDGRISATLQKTAIDHFTEFCIKDGSGRQLAAISAVCCGFQKAAVMRGSSYSAIKI